MSTVDWIEASARYALVMAILMSLSIKFGRCFKDEIRNAISVFAPVGVVPLSCSLYLAFVSRDASRAFPYANEFVVLVAVLFWATSCVMLIRRLFSAITGYQVVCFAAYLLLVDAFGLKYVSEIVLYSAIVFVLGLFIVRLGGGWSAVPSGRSPDESSIAER